MRKALAYLSLCIACSTVLGNTLTEEALITSILSHHPKIQLQALKLDIADAKVTQERGNFDSKLKFKNQQRTQGYYSGDFYEASFQQPIRKFGATVYSGYRRSDGNFPVYEDEFITNSRGEVMAGASVSLFQNGLVNQQLLKLNQSKLDALIADTSFSLAKLANVNKGLQSYWKWQYYGQVVTAYDTLYQAAEKRQKAIVARVERGDLPEIYRLENERFLFQRQSDLIVAKRSMDLAANTLSLYYRDTQGFPLIPTTAQLPSFESSAVPTLNLTERTQSVLASYPRMIELMLELEKVELEQSLVSRQLLPDVEIGYEYSDDQGSGSSSRDIEEHKVKATLAFPLQTRKARGKASAISGKVDYLNQQIQWTEDQIILALSNHHTSIRALEASLETREQALTIAKQLFEAENIRFSSGDSDFFHLNTAEQNLIKAALDYYKDWLELKLHLVEYAIFYL